MSLSRKTGLLIAAAALSVFVCTAFAAPNVKAEANTRVDSLVKDIEKIGINAVRDYYKRNRALSVKDESGWVSIYLEENGLSVMYLISRSGQMAAVNVKDMKSRRVGEASKEFVAPVIKQPVKAPQNAPAPRVPQAKPQPRPQPQTVSQQQPSTPYKNRYLPSSDYNETGTAFVNDILGGELTHTPQGYVVRITNQQGALARAGMRDGDVIFRIYKNHAPRIPSYELEPWLYRFAGKIARFSWIRGNAKMSQLVHFGYADK